MTDNLSSNHLDSSSPDASDRAYAQALETERAYVGKLYDRLDEMREETEGKLKRTRANQSVGGHQNRSERDAYAQHYEDRLAQLNAVDHRLAFGKLDMDDSSTRYIGRIGLATPEHERLMIDWRAPEAGTFYQATAFDRQGVRRRRHLMLEKRTVVGIEDDVLDSLALNDTDALHGEGALLAALNRKRTGRMGDIVATIQAEQDKIIRADLQGVRVVQGGPGTGKTAVALHRAAYLLYSYRERLNNAGVLVVGPSASFMWYIERVLPSLGETGVVMSSLATLYPGLRAVPESDPEVARLKGSLQMAEVIKRAVADRQKLPEKTQKLYVDSMDLQLTPKMVKAARSTARSTGKPHNEARETFVKVLLKELTQQLNEKLDESAGRAVDRPYLQDDVRESLDVRRALNLLWMPLSAETLVRSLFSKQHYLKSATPHLSDADRAKLLRAASAPFTESDVPLLDEAAELLGDFSKVTGVAVAARAAAEHKANLENATKALENMHYALEDVGVDGIITAEQITNLNEEHASRMTAATAAHADRTWAYGHVVVDEAQELSPMQWRLLMRRCPMKSFTIVGDIAQASSAAAAKSWAQALEPFVGERFHLDELTVNYRTPAQISDAAVAVARAAGLEVSAPRAVREGESGPIIVKTVEENLSARAVDIVTDEVKRSGGGLIGVIVAPERLAETTRAVAQAHRGKTGTSKSALEHQILVLTPWDAKGLEFDVVVIVEPADIVKAANGSVGDLYVSMTRPTQRLHIVAAGEIPAGIEA
ncbi:AAA family ATPase [Rothia sp. ZJ1223]|uniref:AAA family ATPase n=1 Tax=Rothia sp. ZJ1223 TaxID=2811098 RepID=UPI00195B87EA|nr:AAA family ATPase [Rothia sp. ZJ1223]MBM7051238.1 AAA family ATPase [Rothia sp. ZJ1223]